MPKKELETKDKEHEFVENFQQRRFETILEWTGWGSLATLLTILAALTLIAGINLDSETTAMILMTIYFWVASWGTGKLVKDNPNAWKRYFYWWTAAIIIGGILCVLGITIVPT
nr:hypothetical protein [Candidatus Freyarchaeota archaeon]